MTEEEAGVIVRRVYFFAGALGVFGAVFYLIWQGWRQALAFALSALISFGTFWLHDWLAHSIVPDIGSEKAKRAWPAGIFALRYLAMLGLAYAIVKALSVSTLPVVAGLLTTTVSVMAASFTEVVQSFFTKRSSQP